MRSWGNYVRLFGGTVRCPAVSHAIPSGYVACSYHVMSLSHSCSGIACDFGEGGAKVGCMDGTEVPCIRRWEEVWVEVDDRIQGFRCDA